MAAALRLPRSMSAQEKEVAAGALIRRLGLTGSADTPVGELASAGSSSHILAGHAVCILT